MSIRINDLYRTAVVSARGKQIGHVTDVLFHAEKPRVVGYVVERPRLLYLFDRRDRFLAADRTDASRAQVVVREPSGAFDKDAARRLGIDWEQTVIWSGMPVRTRSGDEIGSVKDAIFDEDGELEEITLSLGVAADIAVGTRSVTADSVDGYSSGAIVVSDEVASGDTSGGVAAAAGRGAAVAQEQVRQSAQAAGKAIKTAAVYGKAAAKVAADSDTGKKTMKWLRSVRDEIIDAMGDPDDEK